MNNKQINKTLIGKTGKDLLSLMGAKEKRSQSQDIIAPSGSTEIALFNFWKSLLGQDGFGTSDDFFQVGCKKISVNEILTKKWADILDSN